MLRSERARVVGLVTLSAVLVLGSSCVSLVGDRCGEADLPPCPSGTACVESQCRSVADVDAGGSSGGIAGGTAGGTAGGSSGGIAGGTAGGTSGGSSGGTGGGASGGTAGGSSGGASTCSAACPDWEYCSGGSCVARYSSLTLVTPSRTRSDFTALAHLTLSNGAPPNPPSSLHLELRDSDGGTSQLSMMLINDGGFRSGPISAARETRFELTARWLDAGLSAIGTTIVDLTAPTFVVSWPPAPARLFDADSGLDQRDPADADAGVTAWRRDESVPVTISSHASDIDPSTIRLQVSSFDVPLSDAGICSVDGGFCRVANVELWRPTWRAYRGSMQVAVSGADTAGNVGTVDGGQVRLTRWRWGLVIPDLSDANRSSAVAIGQSGSIYAVTRLGAGGTLNAYTPDGERLFRRATLGAPLPPVIGAFAGPDGVMAYLTECDLTCTQVSGVAYGLRNGSTPAVTWQPPAPRRDFNLPVVTSSVARSAETAFLSWADPATNRPALGWRSLIGAGADDAGVLVSSGPATVALPGPLVANGRSLFIPDVDSNKVFGFESSNNFTSPAQSSLGFPGTAAGIINIYNLLIDSSGALIGSGSSANGTKDFRLTYPATITLGPDSTSPFAVILSKGPEVVMVREDDIGNGQTRTRVCTGVLGSTPLCTSDNSENVLSFDMALGEGGLLYTASEDVMSGKAALQVRDLATLAVLWSVPSSDSPLHGFTLDCRRPGAGTLIGQGQGTTPRLYAVIVDSRGVDAAADWPLIRHDPRNTNDRASSLVPYSCP